MEKIKEITFSHKLAIVFAIITSLITLFPQVYLRVNHVDDGIYHGIELVPDSPWSPRVREVMDGHPNFGNIYNKEGKDDPYLFQPLGSIIVGYTGKALGLDINNTILVSRILLPFLTFLIIYAFVYIISREKLLALSCASLLLLADSVLSLWGISQILHGISPDNFLRLARPVNPAMIYIFFFGFLALFWKFYKYGKWQYGFLSALLLGLNFYNYFYTWTYLFAFGGVLGLIFLIQKNWGKVKKISGVFLGGTLFAIPYLYNLYEASTYPAYEEVGKRLGILLTHEPASVGFVVLIALIVFLFGSPKQDKERYLFGLALLLTPFITMNQQLITGKVMQANHYHWFFHKPIAVIFVLIVIFYLLSRYKLIFYKKAFAILIITASVAVGVFTQVHSYYHDSRDGGDIAIERQRYGPVLDWLNSNAEKEAMVFGNDEVSHLVVIYTPLNVLYHRAVCCTTLTATDEQMKDTLFLFYRLRGVDEDSVYDVFNEERKGISAQLHGIYYRKLYGEYEAIPDEKIEEIVLIYKETLSIPTPEWLEGVFSKYEIEYIVWDKNANPTWNLNHSFLEEVAAFEDIVIYEFLKNSEEEGIQ